MKHSDLMSNFKWVKEHQYFTDNHEWINFQGNIAFVGVCPFKLTGFNQVHEVHFNPAKEVLKKGSIIASMSYYNYTINVYMPVDGWIKSLNEDLLSGNQNLILKEPLQGGWLASITPALPCSCQSLLNLDQYLLKQRNRQWG